MKQKCGLSNRKPIKSFFCIFISLILMSASLAYAQGWTSFTSGKRGNASPAHTALSYNDVSVTTSGAHPQCKVSLTIPGASITFPNDNGMLAGKYAALSFTTKSAMVMNYNINGTYRPEEQGEPELPFVRIQVKIPYSVNKVSVGIANTKFNALEGKYAIAPVQEQLFESFIAGVHADNRTFQMNNQIYTANQYFSHEMEYETFICHGYKILEIRYSPLKYNPVTQTLLATNSADIVVSYLDGQLTESNEKSIFTDVINRATFDGINGCVNIVKNPIRGGKVVVVSHTDLLNGSAYSDWKSYRENQGYEFVKEIDASGMNASSIESEIQSQYDSDKFEFLAIVGDWDLVPIPTNGSDYHYKDYSWLEGGDKIPDVGMGVLLADNESTLQIMVDKQKKQEAGGIWSKTVMMTASIEDGGSNWDRFASAHYVTRNMDNPDGGLGYMVHRVYKGSHTNYTSYGGSYGIPETDFEPWALDPNPFVTSSTELRDQVAEYWNTDGNVIVGHRDHGSTSGPSPMTYSMFNGDITSDCSPLFTSLNCSSGNVKSTTSNFSYMSQVKEYGTCATISATVTTYSGDKDYNHMGMYAVMFPEDGSVPETNIGKVFLAGMLEARDHGRTYFHIWGDALTCLALGNLEPFIAITSPNGGEEVEQGSLFNIKWSDNIDGNVKIELLKGGSVASELAASTESDGTFEWQVPGDFPLGADYKMKITSIDSTALFDESNVDFSVVGEYIIVCPYFQPFDTLESEKTTLPKKWEQLTNDDIDWLVLSGPTPSKIGSDPDKTGPDGDHTTGSANYIYIEASGDNNDKKADFVTPKFDFKALGDPKLTFWCHMFSADNTMGDLYLDINVDGTWHNDVVHLTDDHGDEWFEQEVDLNPYKGDRVIFQFRGITGSSWCSDICIDDFKIDGAVPIANNIPETLPGSFDLKFFGSRIHYQVPNIGKASHVSIKLYNLQGKLVKTLVNRSLSADYYSMPVGQLATGIYLCRMEAKSFVKTINMLLTK